MRSVRIGCQISSDLLRSLQETAPANQEPFLNLRTLQLIGLNEGSILNAQLFLVENLTRLNFRLFSETAMELPEILSILTDLPRRCPNITHLVWDQAPGTWIPCTMVFSQKISELVCSYKKLELLYLPNIELTTQAIRHLATLFTLVHLQWIYNEPIPRGPILNGSRASWPALRNMQCKAQLLDSFLAVVAQAVSPLRLENLILGVATTICASEMNHFTTFLGNHCCHKTLRKLRLNLQFSEPLRDAELRVFLSFQNVTDACFEFRGEGILDDSILRGIASAWPLLQSLKLPSESSTTNFTMEGFLALIRGCAKLTSLTIYLEFSITVGESIRYLCGGRPRMRVLDVQGSPIHNHGSIATLFCRVFPTLTGLLYYQNTEWAPDWSIVASVLEVPVHSGGSDSN